MNGRELEDQLLGAEVVVGTSVIGHVDRVVRDHQGRRIVLAVNTGSLDQLADCDGASRTYRASVVGSTPAATHA